MAYNDDENQYTDVKDVLKQLQKVNAPIRFEADLMRRINSGNFESKIKRSFWDIILLPSRLIPSAAMAAAAIVLLFVLNSSPAEQENPFSIEPKVREDIIKSGSNTSLSLDEEMKSIAEKNSSNSKVTGSTRKYYPVQQSSTASFISTSSINKNGLNYRQIYLTDKQKEKIDRLREKLNRYLHLNNGVKK